MLTQWEFLARLESRGTKRLDYLDQISVLADEKVKGVVLVVALTMDRAKMQMETVYHQVLADHDVKVALCTNTLTIDEDLVVLFKSAQIDFVYLSGLYPDYVIFT